MARPLREDLFFCGLPYAYTLYVYDLYAVLGSPEDHDLKFGGEQLVSRKRFLQHMLNKSTLSINPTVLRQLRELFSGNTGYLHMFIGPMVAYFLIFFFFFAKKKKKKCYPLSFPILRGRDSTRALQSTPFQNPGGVP